MTSNAKTIHAIAEARAARDEAMARVEASARGQVDKALIDDVIAAYANERRPFSANDIRDHLPAEITQSVIGNRFMNAAKAGLIRQIGLTPSTKKNTHTKPVTCWIGDHP